MEIRNLNLNDLRVLEPFATFQLPNVTNPLFVVKATVEDGSSVAATVFVQLTSELSIIMNPELSEIKKAKALFKINEFLRKRLHEMGIGDLHVFIKDNTGFEEILKKHFGFEEVRTKPLYLGGL